MKPKNGDMYLRDTDQIIIFHGKAPTEGEPVSQYFTAVFGEAYSGNFASYPTNEMGYLSDVENGNTRYTYIGNISDIFRGILDDKTKAR